MIPTSSSIYNTRNLQTNPLISYFQLSPFNWTTEQIVLQPFVAFARIASNSVANLALVVANAALAVINGTYYYSGAIAHFFNKKTTILTPETIVSAAQKVSSTSQPYAKPEISKDSVSVATPVQAHDMNIMPSASSSWVFSSLKSIWREHRTAIVVSGGLVALSAITILIHHRQNRTSTNHSTIPTPPASTDSTTPTLPTLAPRASIASTTPMSSTSAPPALPTSLIERNWRTAVGAGCTLTIGGLMTGYCFYSR